MLHLKQVSRSAVVALVVLAVGAAAVDALTSEPQPTLAVGAVHPLTGALANFGLPMEYGVLLAADEVTRAGGIAGHYLDLLLRDSQTTSAGAEAAACDLLETHRVPAIIGPAGSANTLAVAKLTVEAGVVQASGSSTSPAISSVKDDGLLFRTVPSDAFQGVVMAKKVAADGHRNVAIINLDDAYGNALAQVFAREFLGAGEDRAVTARVAFDEFALGDGGASRILESVIASEPQAIVLIAFQFEGHAFLSAWEPEAWEGSWYLSDGMREPALTAGEDARGRPMRVKLEGIVGTAPARSQSAAFERFRDAYLKRYGREPGGFSENAYDAAMVIFLALEKTGGKGGEALKQALVDVANPPGVEVGPGEYARAVGLLAAGAEIDYQGASGPIDFDDNGDVAGAIDIWRFESDGSIGTVETVVPQ